MSLKKDFAKVAGSNVLLLIASTLNNFILPIILTMGDYANYKTYLLYVHFIGFFHLGYVDGMNIKYGGVDVDQVDKKTFWAEHHVFLIFQALITVVLLGVAVLRHSLVMMLFALSVLPINMQSFFLFFTQAVGKFNVYAKSVIIVPFLMCIATVIAFVFRSSVDYTIFCIIYLISYLMSWFFLEKRTTQIIPFSSKVIFKSLLNNHKAILYSGFFIMMGTIVFSFFMTTGRWLIKWMMDNNSFAIYSMASSLLGFVLVLVNAVNKVFYPYLCRNKDDSRKNELLISVLLILSTLSLPFYFLLKLIILRFLPNYGESIEIVKLLLLTMPAVVIIQSYFINIYKAKKMERQYLRDGLIYVGISLVLNFSFYFFSKSLISIAIASVLSTYIWFFFPNKDIYTNQQPIYRAMYLLLVVSAFLIVDAFIQNTYIAFLLSLAAIMLINLMFQKKTIQIVIHR